jgi:glycosyltransferase involved in cell wall biosynthesis
VRTVLIIQGQMKQYRVPFFMKLGSALHQDGISLRVAYSDPGPLDGSVDHCDLPDEVGLKIAGYWMLRNRLLYQPLLREIAAADLVISEQANSYVLNYLLAVLSTFGVKRTAFWGMGQNRSERRSECSEWIRRRVVGKANWWFAYTRGTKNYFTSNGAPKERVTVVQNAVDTHEFSELVNSVSEAEASIARGQFGMEEGSCTGLYCGVLNPDKGISFLLEAAPKIKARIAKFHLLIIGSGPERERVEAAARSSSWIHCLGPRFGREKAMLFKLADVFLLPGYVGLAILDAFAAGLPLLSTNVPYHRPEIEYLEHGKNGLLIENNLDAYSEAVSRLLTAPGALSEFKRAASDSGRTYTMEAMVHNFREGIVSSLA